MRLNSSLFKFTLLTLVFVNALALPFEGGNSFHEGKADENKSADLLAEFNGIMSDVIQDVTGRWKDEAEHLADRMQGFADELQGIIQPYKKPSKKTVASSHSRQKSTPQEDLETAAADPSTTTETLPKGVEEQKSAETMISESVVSKSMPKEAKLEEINTEQRKGIETNPDEVESNDKPKESKPDEEKPKETKPDEEKQKETKPEEDKPKETKTEEDKPKETKPEEVKPKEPTPEEDKRKEQKPESQPTSPVPSPKSK
eukprot:Nk52_evm1s41 gene=Nk52_evmTU1s41